MMRTSSRSRNFFRKLVVNGVNNSKAAIQNDCLMRLYDADSELKAISSELDSFDGKKDPVRCNLLVNQLRTAQDKVISLLFQLMDDCNCERASRDYRMKFPDEILLSEGSESLNGQIWFGAECLSAGSNILNHTKESTMLRPMAKTLTTHLDSLRNDLRDLVIDGGGASRINQALIKKMVAFDHIFATFEYEYVRTMLPIRTVAEIEKLQEVAVLFSETLIDCVKRGLIKQDDIDEFQPIIMIAIPRLAIVRGLLYKNENPIYTKHKSKMCSLFQPFHGPLHSIRRLLRGLSPNELFCLEKMLANDQNAIERPFAPPPKQESSDRDRQNEPTQSNEEKNGTASCGCGDESVASTSNNYSNVLIDSLKYPVGQERCVQNPDDPNRLQSNTGLEGQNYDCYFEASSSKAVVASQSQNDSPVGSSQSSSTLSSSVECKRCVEKANKCQGNTEKDDCEKNCCISPSESDSQLEKLIAEFTPSINQESNTATDKLAEPATTKTEREPLTDDKAPSGQPEKSSKSSEDEALLEELFIKQAQQLLHRLFVAISGVADQLQSNFASDLRFILRHIFSSEIEGETNGDDEDDDQESDNKDNEQSGSSSPIEEAVEAQEVANLIDLGFGYSSNSPYDYDQDMQYMPQASSYLNTENTIVYNNPYTNEDMNRYSPSSPLYASVTRRQSNDPETTDTRAFQSISALNQEVNEEVLADLMRGADQTESIYDSRTSPNEPSIMDENRHRQQLVQQHLQSLSRPVRSSSSRSHGQGQRQTTDSNSSQHGVERRSRHHSHGGSRSRRTRGPPVWVPDQLVVACSCCNASFTLFRRRHHCRACGQIFCAECSKFTKNLNCWGYNGPVRVCESCFNQP